MSFASGTEYLDSLVKGYMKYRGFGGSVKAFEADLKNDKDKGFRADKIVQQLLALINAYDLESLREYWSHLNSRFFCRCAISLETAIKKCETNLYRLYVVRAYKSEKPKEIHSFFQKMSGELGNTAEWKDWYVLPYVQSVDSIPAIALYFTRQWAETFLVSLHNLLSSLFASMPEPDFVRACIEDGNEILKLENENRALKKALSIGVTQTYADSRNVEKSSYIRALGVPGSLVESGVGKLQSDNRSKKRLELLTRHSNSSLKDTASTEMDLKIQRNNSMDSGTLLEKLFSKPLLQPSKEESAFTRNEEAEENQNTQSDPSIKQSSEIMLTRSPAAVQIPDRQPSGNASLMNNTPATVGGIDVQYGISENKQKKTQEEDNRVEDDDEPEITYEKNITLTQTTSEGREAPALSEVVASHDFVSKLYAGEPTRRIKDIQGKDTTLKDFGLQQNLLKNVPCTQQSFLVLSKDVFLEHHSSILQCKFDETGKTVGSIDNQGVVKVWQNEPKISTLATVMMNSPIRCLEWSSKPTDILFLGTANGTVRFFDTTKHASCKDVLIDDANSCITNIRAHPSGTSLVAASIEPKSGKKQHPPQTDGILSIWDVHASQVRLIRKLACKNITCMEYNNNGKLLITGDFAGQITIYDMKTFIAIHIWEAHRGQVYSLQFSADETIVYSFGADDQFYAWNVIHLTNRPERNFHLPHTRQTSIGSARPKTMRFIPNPEGNYVLIPSGSKGTIYKLDVKDQSVTSILSLPEHKSPITAIDCAVNNTCGHCLTGSSDGKVQVTTILMHS